MTAYPALAGGQVKGANSSAQVRDRDRILPSRLTDVLPTDYLTPDVAPCGTETGRRQGIRGGFSEGEET